MALASSARGSTSALRDSGPGAAAGSSVPFIAIILLALMVAAVGGGGLILARRLQSLPNISAASLSLGADGSVTYVHSTLPDAKTARTIPLINNNGWWRRWHVKILHSSFCLTAGPILCLTV